MFRRGRATRAFTILELVIVLTVLGLLVGITAPRLVGNADRAQARQAVRGLTDALTAERAETIRSMAPAVLFLAAERGGSGEIRLVGYQKNAAEAAETEPPTAEALTTMLTGQGRVREPFRELGVWTGVRVPTDGATATGGRPAGLDVRTILIDPSGRIRLDRGERIALVASGDGDRIWSIGFDPISGAPSARSE